MPNDVVVVILGGGRGNRLFPLTRKRAKPAVGFGGKYRLIDIPIANCLHSSMDKIFILTQFNSFSLNRHIWQAYSRELPRDGFIDVVAAEQTHIAVDWFQGTADAVRKSMQYILYHRPRHVLILSGDQVYGMDYRKLLDWHQERNAEITIASNYSGEDRLSGLGIVGIKEDFQVAKFYEKPKEISEVSEFRLPEDTYPSGKPYLASMGIYLFETSVLEAALDNEKPDFGKEIIPMCARDYRMVTYPFEGYWEDVGTIGAFYEANMEWRRGGGISEMFQGGTAIVTHSRQLPPSRIHGTLINETIIGDGGNIHAREITRSIIGVKTRIGSGTVIEDSIITGNDEYRQNGIPEIGANCTIRKAICDKNVRIGDGSLIMNREGVEEAENDLYYIRSGIIVIPPDTVIPASTVI